MVTVRSNRIVRERMLYGHARSRNGFTVLELLSVMGIVGLILSLLLPAVGSAREAARRIQCVSQLKQIGIALHNYHDVARCFPPGTQWEASHESAYGWAVPLLPYLEQQAVYEEVDRNSLLASSVNNAARGRSLGIFLCPTDITEATFLLQAEDEITEETSPLFDLPTANYFGVFGALEPDEDEILPRPLGDGTFIDSRSIRLAELTRGTSNIAIIGERTMERLPATWLGVDRQGDDAECRLLGHLFVAPNCMECDECEFASRHPGGSNFLWGDGRVSLVSSNVDSNEYQKFGRRSSY